MKKMDPQRKYIIALTILIVASLKINRLDTRGFSHGRKAPL